MFLSSYHHKIFRSYHHWQRWCPCTHGYEMMHRAWTSIEEVPYCLQGHPSNFKFTWDKKSPILTHKTRSSIEEVPYCFSRSSVEFQCHAGQKNRRFWLKLGVYGQLLQFEFHNGYEMMHKAWSRLGEVLYYFQDHLSNFKVARLKKINDFYRNCVFSDCNSSLNSQMAMKWCTQLEVASERCSIVFQGHPLNFKGTWDRKPRILTRIERFRTVTAVWIQQWLWNDVLCLM